jgi:hypothetical protein
MGTTIVNSTASILKDRAYAQMFGTKTPPTASIGAVTQWKVPLISYGLWMGRDLTVIGSSFIMPSYISPTIQEMTGLSSTDSLRLSQIVSPIVAQFVATPLHCLGLYSVNNPTIERTTLSHHNSLVPNYGNSFRNRSIVGLQRNYIHSSSNISNNTIMSTISNQYKYNSSVFVSSLQNRLKMLQSCFVEVVSARIVRVIPGYGIGGVYNTQFRAEWHTIVNNRQTHYKY